MAPQCIATVIVVGIDKLEVQTLTYRCQRRVHKDNLHHETGVGSNGEQWKMSWTHTEQRRETCLPS